MYDFANSAFATTIMAVVFQEYMKVLVPEGGAKILGLTISAAGAWSFSLATSLAISAGRTRTPPAVPRTWRRPLPSRGDPMWDGLSALTTETKS